MVHQSPPSGPSLSDADLRNLFALDQARAAADRGEPLLKFNQWGANDPLPISSGATLPQLADAVITQYVDYLSSHGNWVGTCDHLDDDFTVDQVRLWTPSIPDLFRCWDCFAVALAEHWASDDGGWQPASCDTCGDDLGEFQILWERQDVIYLARVCRDCVESCIGEPDPAA